MSRRTRRRHLGTAAQLGIDLLRPGSTSIGWVLPLLVACILLALLVGAVGHVIVPWAIYPAL